MPNAVYNSAKAELLTGTIDLDTDTIYAMLVTATYAPDVDAHTKRSHITNEVANGNGYATGGIVVPNKSVAVDNTTNRAKFTHDPLVWADATFTARGMVYYKRRGGAATADEVIGYVDFSSDKSPVAGTLTVTNHADGALYVS